MRRHNGKMQKKVMAFENFIRFICNEDQKMGLQFLH